MAKEYTNYWMFQGEPLMEVPKDASGFVYLIIDKENGMKYIGKKSFWSKRKLKKTADVECCKSSESLMIQQKYQVWYHTEALPSSPFAKTIPF